MAVVPVYVLAGQSNSKRAEVAESVNSALTNLGGNAVVVEAGSTRAGLDEFDAELDWNPSSTDEYYDQMLAQVQATVDAIIAAGDEPVIAGFFWVQGERDAEDQTAAESYAENLQALVDAIGQDFGTDVPIVVAELRTTSDTYTYNQLVRDAQHTVADSEDIVILLETEDLTLDDDEVHYDIPGRIDLGQAMVDSITDHHSALVGPVDTTPKSVFGAAVGDTIYGAGGDDALRGKDGLDTIYGGSGSDKLYGGLAADRLYGGSGDDSMYGDTGNDFLVGGEGTDKLYGGQRDDVLVGGDGADLFFFMDTDTGASQDRVLDFEAGVDRLVVRNLLITSINDGEEGTTILFDNGASVLLEGVAASELTSKSFVLQGSAGFITA